jgi:hypothetical protein
MSTPVPLRSDFDAIGLRMLARRSRDPDQTRRLLALAEIYCQRRSKNASVYRSNNPSLKLARKAANGFGLFLHQARVG